MAEQQQGPNVPAAKPSNLQPMQRIAYHVESGPQVMYTVDAIAAAAKFPHEWSLEPWPASEKSEAPALVVIPEDWLQLSFPRRRSLAIKLGAPPEVRIDEAEKFIAAEYERRVAESNAARKPAEPDTSDRRRPPRERGE